VWIFAAVDRRRRLVLLRGEGAREVVDTLGLAAQYSERGRGWVVELDLLGDVRAFAQSRRKVCIESDRKRGGVA
jgi:hypothetical protein